MSSLTTILEDAEKIVPDLVPDANIVGPVVGVLIKHVEALVGKELDNLDEKVLGVLPPPPAALTPAEEKVAQLEDELAAARSAETPSQDGPSQ